jgi:hypothetical protein
MEYAVEQGLIHQPEYQRALLFHVNNVFHTRVNLLLVVESIFFAALAQTWAVSDGATPLPPLICVLGLLFTILLWLTLGSLKIRSDFLTRHLRKSDSLYHAYLTKSGLYSTLILTHVIPAITAAAWVFLIVWLCIKQ